MVTDMMIIIGIIISVITMMIIMINDNDVIKH